MLIKREIYFVGKYNLLTCSIQVRYLKENYNFYTLCEVNQEHSWSSNKRNRKFSRDCIPRVTFLVTLAESPIHMFMIW